MQAVALNKTVDIGKTLGRRYCITIMGLVYRFCLGNGTYIQRGAVAATMRAVDCSGFSDRSSLSMECLLGVWRQH